MTNFIFTCWTLGVLGAASLALSIFNWVRTRALAEPGEGTVRLVVLRDKPEFEPEKLAEIFETWPDDDRWRAVLQLVDAYMAEAQLTAAGPDAQGNPYVLTNTNGQWLALAALQESMLQLRAGGMQKKPIRRGVPWKLPRREDS